VRAASRIGVGFRLWRSFLPCLAVLPGLGVGSAPPAPGEGKLRRLVASADAKAATTDAQPPAPDCSLDVASGAPLRHVDSAHVVMRLAAECAKRTDRLRWSANGKDVPVVRTERTRDDVYCVLHLGRIEQERVTIAVAASAPDEELVATVTAETIVLRAPMATLELPGQGAIDFIPKNREARVSILAGGGNLTLLPVPDAYRVRRDASGTYVQGQAKATGSVSLRFAYRIRSLPAGLANMDLAVVTEPASRPIRATAIGLHGRRQGHKNARE
jgi:hypothetical protein